MSIQISVVIWTVICFVALYFILKYLLFNPILDIMDKRQEKIEGAKKQVADAEKLLEEKRIQSIAKNEELKQNALIEAKAKADKVRLEGKRLLEDAKFERNKTVSDYQAKIEQELKIEIKTAKSGVDNVAKLFLERLFTD